MNALRNIFSTRALTYLRQNGQNALINIKQPVDSAGTPSLDDPGNVKNAHKHRHSSQPLLIPKSILDATVYTGKKFESKGKSGGTVSPTTLKRYQSMQKKVELVYRCKLCNTRNTKVVTEAAYTSGIVILQCDGCSVNHLIIDHLGWFANTKTKGKSFDQVLAENSDHIKVIKVNEHGELI